MRVSQWSALVLGAVLLTGCQGAVDFFTPPAPIPAVTSFTITSLTPEVMATVDDGKATINFDVPDGTDLTNLVPAITIVGTSVFPATLVAHDFSTPVHYKVTGLKGLSKDYLVTAHRPGPVLSGWWIKGSFDNWQGGFGGTNTHFLAVDSSNANHLSFVMDNLYAMDYEFVLVDPANKELKYNLATNVVPGTVFTMGMFTNNVRFNAGAKSYTVDVDITDPASPTVKLIAGALPSVVATDAVLTSFLKIKGDLFNNINGTAVPAWVATVGTLGANTETWDVVVNNKAGSFGFESLDGWVSDVTIDASTLTSALSPATVPVELKLGSNSTLSGTTMDSNVYTITVTVDATKPVGAGRYLISVALKTLGASNWAFSPWAKVHYVGFGTEFGDWIIENSPYSTVLGSVATYQFAATLASEQFKISPLPMWGSDLGFGGIEVAAGSLPLSSNGGNIAFSATVGATYTITVDFSGTYASIGKPVVKISTP